MPLSDREPALDLAAAARALRDDCARLAQSLAAARNAPPDRLEEAWQGHLTDTQALQQKIQASVAELAARGSHAERMPVSARRELEGCTAEARRLLEEAALAYGDLAADIADVLASIRQRLSDIRQGGRMLRSYRQAAR